ncbi:adenine deaminase [Persicitalea jodogahamensis]|uniref:Adenine deaminase n=1 Tax=Persicitalea jodogahamensis TaxID=402147 RepID=A0A8J3GAC3_9BACT|nr:adenine deaminase [Persicitalea jodogahamensis]GHB71824.1 adenine deaminase [Persicitalea jodogahamensis]
MHANILNIFDRTIREGRLDLNNGRISAISYLGKEVPSLPYVLPGFVDAHVHIESSMLTPSQFARLAVVHGTVATVSDPHEIGNVLGIAGVQYMIEDGNRTPFKFCFGAPSCVPATTFETAGATIGPSDVRKLLAMKEIGYLAEVMNYPGVLNGDPDMTAKIALARAFNKPIDGHAPGLRGDSACRYAEAGISTDHECFTYEEAREKIDYGMNILIREGSAAKNFDALIPLLAEFPKKIMFCSDDKHPDSLVDGHINSLVKRALNLGYDLFDVLQAACLNPVLHYRLPVGLLREGDPADFIVVDNLSDFNITKTYLNGEPVAESGHSLLPDLRSEHVNNFNCLPKSTTDFVCSAPSETISLRIIEVLDGQLITNSIEEEIHAQNGAIESDVERDILKIAVVNRYEEANPAVAFIRNFGLKSGAIASSVGHDSHNIIAVGCDDVSLCKAVNAVIEAKGGISAVGLGQTHTLALPIAGLMTDSDGYDVADAYTQLDQFVKQKLKTTLTSPFMSLSFMALLVIPSLKLSDKGLFDGEKFSLVSLTGGS